MQPRTNSFIAGTIVTGVLSAVATVVVPSIMRRASRQDPVPPFNAVSHMVWGERAAARDDLSMRYTVTGLLLHTGACVFWAAVYEALMRADERAGMRAGGDGYDGRAGPAAPQVRAQPRGNLQPTAAERALGAAAGGVAVTAAAYFTDYHVVPQRLSPGFERRFSLGQFLAVYATLGATLPLRRLIGLLGTRRRSLAASGSGHRAARPRTEEPWWRIGAPPGGFLDRLRASRSQRGGG